MQPIQEYQKALNRFGNLELELKNWGSKCIDFNKLNNDIKLMQELLEQKQMIEEQSIMTEEKYIDLINRFNNIISKGGSGIYLCGDDFQIMKEIILTIKELDCVDWNEIE